MSQKRVSRHRILTSDTSLSVGRQLAMLCCVIAPGLNAQSIPLVEVLQADQTLVQVSDTALAQPVTIATGATLSVERFGEAIRYVASTGETQVRSNWYGSTRNRPWVVYGTRDHQFHELANRVLIQVDESKLLAEIAQDVGATRAKRYAGLGYSILWLPADHDPIGVVKRLQADSRVQRAEMQFKPSRQFPL